MDLLCARRRCPPAPNRGTAGAAVSAVQGGGAVVLVAPAAGRYTVAITGRAALDGDGGIQRLPFAPVVAPVASTEVDLPADLAWSCPGAVVVDDQVRGDRRLVRLAARRGERQVLELRRKGDSAEAEQLLAQTVVLTLFQLRPEGARRHDVVLYEVSRGSLGRFNVALPPGLEVEQAGTDEGAVVPVVENGSLTIHRQRRLQGTGYLVLTSTPAAQSTALDMVRPDLDVRARYLAVSSAVAGEARPLPETAWSRVDLTDLPPSLSEALSALDLTAAWRLSGKDLAGARLAVTTLPSAPSLDATVLRRDTTTLMTVDGTLLHRDRFTLESQSRAGAALDLILPAGATLWSAKVDELPVRPLEHGGTVSVPLGFESGAKAVVEVVAVLERAIPSGRSQLALELPQVRIPVLDHRWKLLLPEGPRYRFQRGDLQPAVEERGPSQILSNLPNDLPLNAEDVITVTAETPMLDERKTGNTQTFRNEPLPSYNFGRKKDKKEEKRRDGDRAAAQSNDLFAQEAQGLQQGLVGGVKPLPLSIPESGKVLLLTGVLPPARVAVELEVKAKR